MIDPSNIIYIDHMGNKDNMSVLSIGEISNCDIEEYDIYDDKQYKKYVSDIEKTVRKSPEYRRMIAYLRDHMDMDQCAFYKNVSTNGDKRSKMKIEIHHSPFTLYDIVVTVIQKRIFYKEDMDVELVAKEVAMLHYKMMVGLIPLGVTPHELVHNAYLFVPVQYVMGRYELFIDYYKEFMTPELLDTYERIEAYSKVYNDDANSKVPLLQNNIHLDVSGSYNLPNFEKLQLVMRDRVQEIKDNNYTLPVLETKKIVPFEFIYGEDYVNTAI